MLEENTTEAFANTNEKIIANQQRFPQSVFGWPLRDAAQIIIFGKPNWRSLAEERIEKFIRLRKNMLSLADLYSCNELRDWSIDHVFIPWFLPKPLKSKKLRDLDYTEYYKNCNQIVSSLCSLISSIEKKGFIQPEEKKKRILGYPLSPDSNQIYIRAGNHRAAVLSALGMTVPITIDNTSLLKVRDQKILSQKRNILGLVTLPKNYPLVEKPEEWPAVRSKTISLEAAKSILNLFTG